MTTELEKIPKYDISVLKKHFKREGGKRDYFFVESDNFDILPKEPYRTDFYGIGLYRKSNIKLKTGLITHIVKAPSIITVGPTVIRSWEQIDDNPSTSLLFFSEPFFLQNNTDVFALRSFDFFEKNDCHILKLEEKTLAKIENIIAQIKDIVNTNHLNEPAIIRSYINILILEIEAAHQSSNSFKRENPQSPNIIADKFKALLAIEFKNHRSVSFYAEELNISPKYFSTVIKEQTGKTAGEWIDQIVILEARVLLQKQELTISQIADLLNFNELSTFSKFFKKLTNLPPLTYRKLHQK